MKNAVVLAFVLLGVAAGMRGQTPTQAPAPTGLVVGSGNFFSPIVADLDKAIAFYRDGLGLDVQGDPANADANPALRAMFGLPDAQLRWSIGRPPAMRTGVEIVEIKKADGKRIERRVQDSGAFKLILIVRDLDAVVARLKPLGAPVATTGGAPVEVGFGGAGTARAIVVKDPDGHFVEVIQPPPSAASTEAGAPNITAIRVRLTVDDVEQSAKLYRDVLGLQQRSPGEFRDDQRVRDMLGLKSGQYRVATMEVPTSGLVVELIDFKGVDRARPRGRIQDPGSTRMQLQVRDVDAAIAGLTRAGGTVVSSGGRTVDLPGRGGATTKVAIVQDPDNLFLVLLQAAPPRTP